ncbi:MAG: cation transporting ATPase C-terminal domain-containing protein [Halioglobus sp.]|nr:cation transporting ATPase C-terminal domain-containing protein [Halioglobus sp.]
MRDESTLAFARTLAVNALVIGEIVYLLNARFFHAPSWTIAGLTGNKVMLFAIGACLGLQLLFTYAPFMNRFFDTEALDATAWLYCFGVGLTVFILVEIEKLFVRKRLAGGTGGDGGSRSGGTQGGPRTGEAEDDATERAKKPIGGERRDGSHNEQAHGCRAARHL